MAGKILKVSANDVYGEVDERVVVVFACFEHTKYMNNYVIFSFLGEYDKNKLCYGSVHMKKNSIVTFSVKNDIKQYIDEFLNEYESNKVNNYKILDISDMERIEIVSYNEMDYNKLQFLDDISIMKVVEEKVEEDIKEKQPVFLYIMLFILIAFAIGLSLLYFKPDLFGVKYKQLLCNITLYDNDLNLEYEIEKNIRFDLDDKVESIDVVKYYTFISSDDYYEFKDNEKHIEYLKNGEGYKYIDDALQFRVMYQETSVIDDYDEMKVYLDREGFSCKEVEYER